MTELTIGWLVLLAQNGKGQLSFDCLASHRLLVIQIFSSSKTDSFVVLKISRQVFLEK